MSAFGSVEEHGYHLPLSTDCDIALAIAKKLGEGLGILVAPPVWYGVANTTKDYVGSVMLWSKKKQLISQNHLLE